MNLRWTLSRLKGNAASADLEGSLFSYVRLPVGVIVTLALTIILGGLALWSWSDFSDYLSDAKTIVSAIAIATEDNARNSLDAVDTVLETVVARVEEKGIENLGSEAETESLRRLERRLPITAAIIVADREGNIVAAAPTLGSSLNVSDHDWFRSLKEGRAEPQVGRIRGDTDNDLYFPVARSIRGPDKAFVGAVQIRVGLTHFANVLRNLESVFRTLDVKSEAKLEVYRIADRAVVARFPMPKAPHDETAAALPNTVGDSWTGWTRVGGEKHLVAARSYRRKLVTDRIGKAAYRGVA